MAFKLQEVAGFNGYGLGLAPGEHFYSQGMRRSRSGIKPGWLTFQEATSETLTTLQLVNAFAESTISGETKVYSFEFTSGFGSIHGTPIGTVSWALEYIPGNTNLGNGMITDPKGRLIYAGTRYIGKFDGTANYTTGTLSATNGSPNLVGSGTTWVSGDVGKRIKIGTAWYTILTFTDATHIALSTNFAESTASGLSYAIYRGWTDQFKDFSTDLSDPTQVLGMCTYEDTVIIPHTSSTTSAFGALFTGDDSFNATAFTLPTGFSALTCRAGRNGVLLGVNFQNKGILMLWDGYSTRSTAPWIHLNGVLQAIVPYNGDWIVITNKEILTTNGYTTQFLTRRPDQPTHTVGFTLSPNGADVIASQYLIINNSSGAVNRRRIGLELFDLSTNTWNYAPYTTFTQDSCNTGAVFTDSRLRTHYSWLPTVTPGRNRIGFIQGSCPASAIYIVEAGQLSDSEKVALATRLKLVCDDESITASTVTMDVSAKIYNFKRPLWSGGGTNGVSATAITLRVDESSSSFNVASVGDMVWIMEGANAGQIRHIASKTGGGTSSCVWTLDFALPNVTETSINFVTCPFQKISKHAYSARTEMDDVYFSIKNKVKGKKFLLMFLFENIGSAAPDISGVDLAYQDMGIYG